VFYVASRFVRPLAAAAIGFLAVVWSLPNYPGAMASWYNLFLATIGVALLLRWLEDARARWLVLAGLAGGLSILAKIIGLYYVAGGLLFLLYHAQGRTSTPDDDAASGSWTSTTLVIGALAVFVAVLVRLVWVHLHASEFLQFVLPGALIALLLARNEWTARAAARTRLALLGRVVTPFLAGVALPVALFVVWYAKSGALRPLLHGVLVAPQLRLAHIAVHAPAPWTLLAAAPFVLFVALVYRVHGALTRRELVLFVLALLLLLRATGGNGALYRTVWFAARSLLPALAVAGTVLLARKREPRTRLLLDERTMLVLAVTSLCSLAQYPYTTSVYFCYVAPLVVLLVPALYSHARLPHRAGPVLLIAFFTAFAVLRINATRIASVGNWYQAQPRLARLAMDRGGIDVQEMDARSYGALVAKLRAHSRGGYTWASPDSPEVYFLSGLRNPTRTLFEVFDEGPAAPEAMMRLLDAHGVTAIVLSSPSFSPPISPALYALVASRYPNAEYVGVFQLRWRE